ncbi:MAG: T9SS type A sorting domain-containing protein [Chlorobi bacterium]|nr:T9SS type A sorting domain-containing protein [Chlorobiota bacterium]
MKNLITVLLLFSAALSLFAQTDESYKLYDDSEVGSIEITIDTVALAWIYEHPQSDSMRVANVHFKNKWIDEYVDSVGFRLRGNTSREAQKKSFKVSFNTFFKGRKFYGVEKLNLNGEHNDPSIIRSKLCWDLFGEIGMTASRAAHIAVYVNGEYYGLYISVEHIDEEFVAKNYDDDSGNLWKCLYPADLTYRGPDPEDYYPYAENDRPYELKTNKEEFDYAPLAKLISIINLTPDDELPDSLESFLNIKEVLQYFAMDVLLGSWDDYRSLMNNYYLYFEPKENIFHLIPYDYDNTFGIDWFEVDWANANPYDFPKVADGSRPLAERLLNNNQYRNLFTHFLEFYNDNVVNISNLGYPIYLIKDMITPFAEDDYYRTLDYGFTMDDFNNSYSLDGYSNQHVKRGLQEFISVRNQSLPAMLNYVEADPIVYDIKVFPENPQPEDTIYISASVFDNDEISAVGIKYQYPMLPTIIDEPMTYSPVEGTKRVEESDLWKGNLHPLGEGKSVKFKVYAIDGEGNVFDFPRTKYITVSSPSANVSNLKINELLAKNDTTLADQDGEFDDWLEIFNPTWETIDLSGSYLTDKKTNLTKWSFPEGTTIQPEEHLLIWCDEDENQSGLHTNFKLSANGEFLALVASDGVTVIDSVTFPAQTADISYGRYPDAEESWRFMSPTPRQPNDNVLAAEDDENLPSQFKLRQNYPNPFNPSTTIKYELPEAGFVTLRIYDLLGREILTLVNKKQSSGKYEVKFDAGRLTSGIYIYQLRAGQFSESRKAMLMK